MAETKTARKGTRSNGFTAEERAAMKERSRELKAAGRGKKADGESDVLAKIAEMKGTDRVMAERLHAPDQGQHPGAFAENLVRDARLRQGRQGSVLLQTRREVQDEVRDARLQRQGEPRRRRHVADRIRAHIVDRHRRERITELVKRAMS